MFCWSLFVLLYFFFWPLCCLFFFVIRNLIAHLVSSKSFFKSTSAGLSSTGGYWKKMRSRKIPHRCNGSMRGLSTHFYLNILNDMRCHISIHLFKILNSATIAVFHWHIQCICKHSLIVLQFVSPLTIFISTIFTHMGQLLHCTLTHLLKTECSITPF